MELLLWALMIYLAYVIIRALIIYVIIPVGKWATIGLTGAGLVIGVFAALKAYIKSIVRNANPYRYYRDRSKNRQIYAKRCSYFFGPGYVQLGKTIGDAWRDIGRTLGKVYNFREGMAEIVDGVPLLYQAMWLLSWLFFLCAAFSVGVLGGAITLLLSGIHTAVLLSFMLVIYALFSVTWVIDRIYLQLKAIRTSCPVCQERSVIPVFACPGCNRMHTRLVPGPYGIWHRRCVCGQRLPTTFLLGRSALKASCKCGSELAASDVQQFSLTIVGGPTSGKTVLLAAFYHELFEKIAARKHVRCEIPAICAPMFKNLERWFGGESCGATEEGQTSEMYSVLIKANVLDVDKQFSLYDISGESFSDPALASMLPQKQMRDSNGVVIVIDPLSAPVMRAAADAAGDDIGNYSKTEASEVVSNFVTYLKTVLTNSKISAKSKKPVAVVISKTDLISISRMISYERIRSIMKGNPGMFDSFAEARDEISREFLKDIGLNDAVMAIEAAFSEVHYFPASAMGHAENGEEYQPEHAAEPFWWLISRAEPALAELIGIVTE